MDETATNTQSKHLEDMTHEELLAYARGVDAGKANAVSREELMRIVGDKSTVANLKVHPKSNLAYQVASPKRRDVLNFTALSPIEICGMIGGLLMFLVPFLMFEVFG